MCILREIEDRKHVLSNDLVMVVAISENYTLNVKFKIVSSKVDKKFRDKTYGLGKSTYDCFLCSASSKDTRDPSRIEEGFPINRSLAEIKELAEFQRYDILMLHNN